MTHASAVRPGQNLSDHARALVRTHSAVLEGQPPALRPRDVVARSWRRVMDLGLSPDGRNLRDPMPPEEVERRRRESGLHGVVDELATVFGGGTDVAHMLLVVTDADGIILWREGTPGVRRAADQLGFAVGATWTEARVGTNAIGTALAEAAPVQLFSAEHFEQTQHPWYCSAAPVHDPRTGRLLGVLDVSGPALTLHPAVGALVETARRLAEARLWRAHQADLERLRRDAAPVLARVGGPAVVVDDDGWVADSRGVAVGDRLTAPREDLVLSVPGLGVCTCERLGAGWLVRPAGPARGAAPALQLALTLDGDPVLEVRAGDSRWLHRLTRRHAEILVLLDGAGPAGLTAAALSRALYGDGDHVVTARAEVSRLRRAVGGVVDTGPYRISAGASLTVVQR